MTRLAQGDKVKKVRIFRAWFSHYKKVSRGRDVPGRYLAANGTPVTMGERVSVSVVFCVEREDGTQDAQEFQLECNVGQTAHNIIRTTQLMKKGWTSGIRK